MAGVAIITGASAGIGRATAELFLASGWQVGLWARKAAALEEIAAPYPERALVLTCDVTDTEAVEAAFTATVARFGPLDFLFNNAGISRPAGLIDEIPLADWRYTVAVNLDGMFLCARAAFVRMPRKDPQVGRIVNNGSISVHVPRPG